MPLQRTPSGTIRNAKQCPTCNGFRHRTCKGCGTAGLRWDRINGSFRLIDCATGSAHTCVSGQYAPKNGGTPVSAQSVQAQPYNGALSQAMSAGLMTDAAQTVPQQTVDTIGALIAKAESVTGSGVGVDPNALAQMVRDAVADAVKGLGTQPVQVEASLSSAGITYRPDPELVGMFNAIRAAQQRGKHKNLMLIGGSGSGKGEGMRYLAETAGMDLVKIDASSMVDSESWFGSKEITVVNGAPQTEYVPSAMVRALRSTKPTVIFIDEINRVSDQQRQVLLPLLDGSRAVMNPLTGEIETAGPNIMFAMAGNVGIEYTGTHAIDPAFTSRAVFHEVRYADIDTETSILVEAGCDALTAETLARFGADTRAKAQYEPDFPVVSTRALLSVVDLYVSGLDLDAAIRASVILPVSAEGGAQSPRAMLDVLWTGARRNAGI
jgi:MoxR-like ATPase